MRGLACVSVVLVAALSPCAEGAARNSGKAMAVPRMFIGHAHYRTRATHNCLFLRKETAITAICTRSCGWLDTDASLGAMSRFLAMICLMSASCGGQKPTPNMESSSPGEALCAIAQEIEAAKKSHPQLVHFSAAKHCDAENLVVSYGYETHQSQNSGGWTASVPNPDPEGVWFHLDFHDANSTAQIHTQPVVPHRHFQSYSVTLLLLDGSNTKSLAALIDSAMKRHGVRAGQPKF